MSTLLYVENPIVLSDNEVTPVIEGIEKSIAGFASPGSTDPISTTKTFSYTFPTKNHLRQLLEFKFKINSSKITSNKIGYIKDFSQYFTIPQILIDTSGELGIFIHGETMHQIDPATGLPLWVDATTGEFTTTPQYTLDGSLNMAQIVVTSSCYEYKIKLVKDQYYTLKILLDYTAKYAYIIINNTMIGLNHIPGSDNMTDSYENYFRNCEFLDADYFKLVDLDSGSTSSSSTITDFNVTKSLKQLNDIQDGVM